MTLKLTQLERQMLVNQHAILAKLYPHESGYHEKAQEVFQSGYEVFYSSYMITSDDSELMLSNVGSEVMNILDMFRATENAYKELGKPASVNEDSIKYLGFDGNNEGKQCGFVKFLKSDNRYDFLLGGRDGDNSHQEMLPTYRRKHAEWKKSANIWELTEDDLKRIASA